MTDTSRFRLLSCAYGILMLAALGANLLVASDPSFHWSIWPLISMMASMGLYLDIRTHKPVLARLLVFLTFVGLGGYAVWADLKRLTSVLIPEILLYAVFLIMVDLWEKGIRPTSRAAPADRTLQLQFIHGQVLVIASILAIFGQPTISAVSGTVAVSLGVAQALLVWVFRLSNSLSWIIFSLSLAFSFVSIWSYQANHILSGIFILATLLFGSALVSRRSTQHPYGFHLGQPESEGDNSPNSMRNP